MAETTDNKQTNRQDVALFVIAGIAFVFLIIVICYTVRTFLPQKYCFPESINVNIVDAGGYNKELSAEGKYYLKEQLHTALMEVSEKAESAYNEKFATLLTILAFFGVAWPLILSLFQNMNFRQEIDKQSEQFQQQQQQQSEDFQRQYNTLFMNIQRKQQQQSEDFQRQHKNLSMDIQRQQKQFSKDIQKQQKQFSDDFQKQKLYLSKMVDDSISTMSATG